MTPSPAQALADGPAAGPGLTWPGGSLARGSLREEVGRLAAAIRQACPAEQPVGILSASRRRVALGVLAADWAGHAALPLDPAAPGIAAALDLAGVGVVIRDNDQPAPENVPALSFDAGGVRAVPCRGSGDLIVATSGATGTPRLVVVDGPAMAAQAGASAAVLPPLSPGAHWLVCMPMTSIGALAALWRAFRAGAGVAVLERFDPADAAALIRAGASHVSLVPAMLPPLVRQLGPDPGALSCVLAGGGPLSRVVARRAVEARWPLWTGWGMTETASHVAAGPVDERWEAGIAGRPLPGITIGRDPVTGRLKVAGPTLMRGRLGPHGMSGLEPDGSLLTSDIGDVTEDGRIRILGRADQVIVSGGVNVYPETVEALLAECEDLGEAAVAAIPDPEWGQRVLAFYTGELSPEQADVAARQHWTERGFASALRPRAWCRVPALPRNAMGKLDRPAVAAMAGEFRDRRRA